MESMISPFNKAHQHASNAEEFVSRGLLIPASEEHYKAAELFQACVENTNDESTKRTLRMLYDDNNKSGKELQRKIAQIKASGGDPSLPQTVSRRSSAQHREPSRQATGRSLLAPKGLDSSSGTVDESFMVLNQQSEHVDDPFNNLWKVTGEMMDNLSQPFSFQAAALAALEAFEEKMALNTEDKPSSSKGKHVSDDEEYDSSDSFFVIPTKAESCSSCLKLKKENAELKSLVENMQSQIASIKKQMTMRVEQDNQLRDTLLLARKEAQRVMVASSTIPRPPGDIVLPSHIPNVQPSPLISTGRDRETQLLGRIRELENEVRSVRSENEKQKQMITKFRERWEKLKESAKRKRDAKAATQAEESTVRDRIDEDPEGEAAAEQLG